jgi:transposase
MQPPIWKPPVELSKQEEQIVKKIRKAKLFVFLRQQRHELFNEAFQQELANLYRPAERGQPPIAPAMLALALILQAYMGISDDEVIEATIMDRRWQLVLDCLDTEQAPFSKGTLVAFRKLLIEAQMDRRLIERTIEIASHSQAFGPRADAALLWIVVRCGEPDASRIRIIWWDTRSKRSCAWWLTSRGGSWSKWRKRPEQQWCVRRA